MASLRLAVSKGLIAELFYLAADTGLLGRPPRGPVAAQLALWAGETGGDLDLELVVVVAREVARVIDERRQGASGS